MWHKLLQTFIDIVNAASGGSLVINNDHVIERRFRIDVRLQIQF